MAQNNDETAGLIMIGAPIFVVLMIAGYVLYALLLIFGTIWWLYIGAMALAAMVDLYRNDKGKLAALMAVVLAIGAAVALSTTAYKPESETLKNVLCLTVLPLTLLGVGNILYTNSTTPPAPAPSGAGAAGLGGGEPAHNPAFDFDPSRFADRQDAPASSSREVATVGADNDETDERLWRMAQDPRTPENERQAAMKAIQRRGKPSPRQRKR